MTAIPAILTPTGVSVMIGTDSYAVDKSHKKFETIINYLRDNGDDPEYVRDLIDLKRFVENQSMGKVEIRDGQVLVNTEEGEIPVDDTLQNRLLDMIELGFNVDPLVKFIENISQNPTRHVLQDLYSFLERHHHTITSDGHFLAYKKVQADYTDCYTGTMDNSVGQTVQMPRSGVDDKRENTCSSGLHVCAKDYLSSFGGSRVVICKINPKDVVAIPPDYNESKMRVCKYVVIDELDVGFVEEDMTSPVYN